MRVVADLHVHSKYARATSRENDLDGLSVGAKTKGINVMATGDFTHPLYFNELKAKLAGRDDNGGLYEYGGVRFILSTEISLIYSSKRVASSNGHGTLRMHHIVLAPSLEIASQINDTLGKRGNLASDGRPILGLSSPEFADVLFGISKDIMIIPAHAWTPWFSVFGSMSGVNTIEQAFGDRAKDIFAIETGLSSDPAMNWMISGLDKYSLVSNSDAHSLDNLGREANVFEFPGAPTYTALRDAIKTRKGFVKTYEFYPEEGKYHYDGHRDCGIRWSPWETKSHNGICTVCRKPVTVGVMNRVAELADRKPGFRPEGAVPFQYIVPLRTVISKTIGKGEKTGAVFREYDKLVRQFGSEFAVYESNEEKIRPATEPAIADAIIRAKNGNVRWLPGYDGVFGELILDEKSAPKGASDKKQMSLGDF
jgi:uncharacterized protein (TIGR00375 family)